MRSNFSSPADLQAALFWNRFLFHLGLSQIWTQCLSASTSWQKRAWSFWASFDPISWRHIFARILSRHSQLQSARFASSTHWQPKRFDRARDWFTGFAVSDCEKLFTLLCRPRHQLAKQVNWSVTLAEEQLTAEIMADRSKFNNQHEIHIGHVGWWRRERQLHRQRRPLQRKVSTCTRGRSEMDRQERLLTDGNLAAAWSTSPFNDRDNNAYFLARSSLLEAFEKCNSQSHYVRKRIIASSLLSFWISHAGVSSSTLYQGAPFIVSASNWTTESIRKRKDKPESLRTSWTWSKGWMSEHIRCDIWKGEQTHLLQATICLEKK